MTFPCWGVVLGITVAALGQRGTIQGTLWISEPMHTFFKSSGIDGEQVLSRVRYEPTPQVFVQADQGLQSNSFFTETVSETIFYCSTVRNAGTSATKFGKISKTRTINNWQHEARSTHQISLLILPTFPTNMYACLIPTLQNPLFPAPKKIIKNVFNAWQGLNYLFKPGANLKKKSFIYRKVKMVISFSH